MAEKNSKKTRSVSFPRGIAVGIVIGIILTSIGISIFESNANLFGFASLFSTITPASSLQKAANASAAQAQTSSGQISLTGSEVKMLIPAVDDNGNGVTPSLTVQAKPGTGKVLIDVNNLFFFVDTQNSIRTAREVAQNITGADFSKIDLTYTVDANVSAVEGPSAGAALTIATIAAVENKPVNSSVIITGTINPDGTIGQIGGVLQKAQAAKAAGASLFLVPGGQGTNSTYAPVQTCQNVGSLVYCTTNYKGTTTDISSQTGIKVKEVGTLKDALQYFIS